MEIKKELKIKKHEYYIKNKSKILKQKIKYYIENKKKIKLYLQNWYKRNAAKCKKHAIQWTLKNPKKYRLIQNKYRRKWKQTLKGRLYITASAHRRRLLDKGLTPYKIYCVYRRNLKLYGTLTCELCFTSIRKNEDSLEHFIPLTRKGTHNIKNLGIAHGTFSKQKCNNRKGNMTLKEWFQGKGKIYLKNIKPDIHIFGKCNKVYNSLG